MNRLARRLQRLEACRPPGAEAPYTPPEPPSEWYCEVYGLLLQYGHLHEVLRSWGLSEPEVVVWAVAIAEECRNETC
jgi:hypothetical protein